MAELPGEFGVHPTAINRWKRQVLDLWPTLLSGKVDQEGDELVSRLYQEIGQLKVELEWLKKNQILSVSQKRSLVDFNHPQLSLTKQCDLLCLSRSSLYYQPVPEDEENVWLMNLIDEQFLKTPFYGRCRMTHVLRQK